MARVYLDTTLFSAYVSTRTDPKSIVWRETSREWWATQSKRHELFVSEEVVLELSSNSFPGRNAALELLRGLRIIELSADVRGLAEILVREKLMPAPATSGDAIHVAAATIHRMDYLLTWNVRHLANPNKRAHLATICIRLGCLPPEIVTPDLLQELGDE